MPTSRKIRGKKLTLTFGSTDYACDATSIVLESEEADDDATTFCDAQQGGARQWFFTIEAIQSMQTSSFWRYLWENTGEEIAYVFAPEGNETATADSPHFTGLLTVGAKPNVGGEANSTFTFETRLDCTAEPTLDEGD